MNQYDYQYFQWLQSCIKAVEQRMTNIEKMVQELSDELKGLKEKPTIHVDTIEYKFDQLKVETLEGTLNIGLNPTDMQGIEDFAVNNQNVNIPVSPKEQMQRSMEIEESILQYLETDLPDIVQDTGTRLNIPSSESYLSFIKEDIKKQLPSRIDHYMRSSLSNHLSDENQSEANQKIIEQIKQEIQNGISIFLNHLPENVKGMKNDEL